MRPIFIINAEQSRMEEIEILGNPALYTRHRVSRETVPQGMNCYEMRGIGNRPFLKYVLTKQTDADFLGTVLTLLPIELGDLGIRAVTPVDIKTQGIRQYYFPSEFMDKYLTPADDPERYGKQD